MTVTYFTFGQSHMTSFELPRGGRLADYWVAVELENDTINPREVFIRDFTSHYCPDPLQFGFEYAEEHFDPSYFPKGELTRLKGLPND